MKSHTTQNNPEIKPFDVIYYGAKEKNKKKINEALVHATIDVYEGTENCTPAGKLAAEADIDALAFLRKHFDVQLCWIAGGFARGGHATLAYELLALARDTYPEQVPSILKLMAEGFATAGKKTETHAYAVLTEIQEKYSYHLAEAMELVAEGFAYGGHKKIAFKFFFKLMKTHPKPVDMARSIARSIAYGFAESGREPFADELLKMVHEIYPDQVAGVLQSMAAGFACRGHDVLAYAAIDEIQQKYSDRLAIVLEVVGEHFAFGGHTILAAELLIKMTDKYFSPAGFLKARMVDAFAGGGHITPAYKLLDETKVEFNGSAGDPGVMIAGGFASGGHKIPAYNALEHVRMEYPKLLDYALNMMARGFCESGYETFVYDFLDRVKYKYPDQVGRVQQSVAAGFAASCHMDCAYNFIDKAKLEFPDQLSDLILEIAISLSGCGHESLSYVFLAKMKREYSHYVPDALQWMAHSFSSSGYKKNSYTLLSNIQEQNYHNSVVGNMLFRIAQGEHVEQDTCIDKDIVLRTLAGINDKGYRKHIAKKIKPYIPKEHYDVSKVLQQSTKYNQHMIEHHITYPQLLGWIQPAVQVWLLQGIVLANKLNLSANIYLLITAFLMPPMRNQDICDLSNKLAMRTYSGRFFGELKQNNKLLIGNELNKLLKTNIFIDSDETKEEGQMKRIQFN